MVYYVHWWWIDNVTCGYLVVDSDLLGRKIRATGNGRTGSVWYGIMEEYPDDYDRLQRGA